MQNILDYKKRFYKLLESTIGDVKPLLNEDVKTFGEGINTYGYAMGSYPTCIGAHVICPGGTNGDWDGSLPKVLEICNLTDITPGSQKRWTKLSASGNISNHWCGLPYQYGVDLPCNVPKGDEEYEKIKEGLLSKGWITEADAKSSNWKPANKNYTTFRHDSFKCQVLWKCDGDHYNHIHVGCKKENPTIKSISEKCNYDESITTPKISITSFKKIWEELIEKPIIKNFSPKEETISRPDLIKIKSFNEKSVLDYHTFFEYANIKFVGDGTNGVSITAMGERKENEDEPSKFFIDVFKSDKGGFNTGEKQTFGDIQNLDLSTFELEAKDATNYFMDLCRNFEQYPYFKGEPKSFENENPLGL